MDLFLGTNDAFVSVEFGKEKFLTGVQEKCENPNWNEECLLWVFKIILFDDTTIFLIVPTPVESENICSVYMALTTWLHILVNTANKHIMF